MASSLVAMICKRSKRKRARSQRSADAVSGRVQVVQPHGAITLLRRLGGGAEGADVLRAHDLSLANSRGDSTRREVIGRALRAAFAGSAYVESEEDFNLVLWSVSTY